MSVDLVLLLVVLWSSVRELDEAVLWGLLGGAFVDMLSTAPFGTELLTLGILSIAANAVGPALRQLHEYLLLAVTPLATVVSCLLLGLILQSQGWPVDWPSTVGLVILPASVVNTLGAPLVYWFVRAADGWFQPRTWLA